MKSPARAENRKWWLTAFCSGLLVLPWTGSAETLHLSGAKPELDHFTSPELEKEYQNDQQVWQLTRQLLSDFGYPDKVQPMDSLWDATRTPDQWAALRITGWPETNEYDKHWQTIVELCRAHANDSFSQVFQIVCHSGQSVADMFTGLVLWTQQGGEPRLQNSDHYALHFVYGGGTQATVGMGVAAAIGKEMSDQAGGGDFNLDEMAAAIAGAEWVHQAETNPKWVSQWASGQKSLQRNLPPLHYGIGEYSPQIVARIHRDIVDAYAR